MSDEFVYLGSFFVLRAQRQPYMNSALVPELFYASSDCIASRIPDTWGLHWASSAHDAQGLQKLGWDEEALRKMKDWCTEQFDQTLGWPGIFLTIDAARSFAKLFLQERTNVDLLAVTLSAQDRERFLATWTNEEPTVGIPAMVQLARENRFWGEGQSLGSELIGWESGSYHSHLCHGLETVAFERFGIRPNENGLLDDHAQAQRIAKVIDEEELGEPVPWFAFRLWKLER